MHGANVHDFDFSCNARTLYLYYFKNNFFFLEKAKLMLCSRSFDACVIFCP